MKKRINLDYQSPKLSTKLNNLNLDTIFQETNTQNIKKYIFKIVSNIITMHLLLSKEKCVTNTASKTSGRTFNDGIFLYISMVSKTILFQLNYRNEKK